MNDNEKKSPLEVIYNNVALVRTLLGAAEPQDPATLACIKAAVYRLAMIESYVAGLRTEVAEHV